MVSAMSLFGTLLLALSVAATPTAVRSTHITLPVAKRFHSNGRTINVIQHDQARASALKAPRTIAQSSRLNGRDDGISATNQDGVSYLVEIGVGDPPTTFDVILDSGSANTWVGAGKSYTKTSTSHDTGQSASVSYGTGSFNGEEYLDTVTLGSGFTIDQQSIGVAAQSSFFSGTDGILGIGPVSLTQNTLVNEPEAYIPTVTDNLYTQGTIGEGIVSVFFAPPIHGNDQNGEITFGSIDPSKYDGTLTYTTLTEEQPAMNYWGIDQSITYGNTTILGTTAGVVDTGTTLLLIASDAFATYRSATGGAIDDITGMLIFSNDQYGNLQDLVFNIGYGTYALTPNARIRPRSLNTYIGGTTDAIYGIVADLGSPSGQGLDIINGQAFLERFSSVFDTTNVRVGLVTTAYTNATT